jgi:hypothetical protein
MKTPRSNKPRVGPSGWLFLALAVVGFVTALALALCSH